MADEEEVRTDMRESTQQPLEAGSVTTAVLDDTCGNLIQLAAMR